MAEERTLARPYAEAVFDLAQEGSRLAEWGEALETLAAIAANADVASVLGNPVVSDEKVAEAIIGIAGDVLDKQGSNLVKVLADNGRLALLPAIHEQYVALRADAENRVDVEVTSAAELSEEQREQLAKSLRKRLNREITLSVSVDPSLIGGAVVRAGDTVMDNSVRAQLGRLQQALAH